MRLKFATFALALLLVPLLRADTTIVDVSASACTSCYPGYVLPPINLQAVFTVRPMTGTFFDSGQSFSFVGTEYEVINAVGTLNGFPITLASGGGGVVSWLWDSPYPAGDFALGTVYFTSNGSFSWLENDDDFNLLEILDSDGDGYGSNNAITWNATDPPPPTDPPTNTPEPSPVLLSGMGMLAIAIWKTRDKPPKFGS